METIHTDEVLAKIKSTLDQIGTLYLVCLGGAFVVIWLTSGFSMALAVITAFVVGGAISHSSDIKRLRAQLEREVRDGKEKQEHEQV